MEFRRNSNDELELNNSEVMIKRFNHFNIPGSKASDYSEKVIDISSERSVLVGIRHTGGNVEKPFVSVWPNFMIEDNKDIDSIKYNIKDQFKVFQPKHLQIWLNPKSNLSKEIEVKNPPNQRYLAELVNHIIELEKPDKYSKIELIKINSNEYREWYKKTYKEFHSSHPNLIDWVPINDEEDIQKCIDDNLFFYAIIDGSRAGVIGAHSSHLFGLKGAYISEILISKKFKGQYFAPAIQRKFIDQKLTDFDLVWGTIDAQNIPSTKTALRVGRKPIRAEYFVPIC